MTGDPTFESALYRVSLTALALAITAGCVLVLVARAVSR